MVKVLRSLTVATGIALVAAAVVPAHAAERRGDYGRHDYDRARHEHERHERHYYHPRGYMVQPVAPVYTPPPVVYAPPPPPAPGFTIVFPLHFH